MSNDTQATRTFSTRRYMTVGIIGLTVLVGGFGSWGVFANISGAVVASGIVEVDQNRQVVQHPDGGVVDEIIVDEGDLVAEGDLLIRLDPTTLASDLAIVESQLFEFIARRGRLEAERDDSNALSFDAELLELAAERPELQDLIEGQQRLFEARNTSLLREQEQLTRRKGQILTQVDGINAQMNSLEMQIALIRQELADQQSLLDRGLAQASRVLALQRAEVDLDGRMGELVAASAQAEERITEIDIEILKLDTRRREAAITQLRDVQVRELELAEQRRALLGRLGRLDIRAPVSGIVYAKQIFTPRSVIRPAEPVLYLIPQDRPLVIAAQVDPIHRDQVFPSQKAIVRFSSFDIRSSPELEADVLQISADALVDERDRRSYYRAELRLADGEIDKIPDDLLLVPGMPVEAFIRTNDRSPLNYLVKPLTDYFVKAFRES